MTHDLRSLFDARGQKLLFLNIRSLYANHSQLECDFMNSNIYMICLTESWLKPSTKSHIVDISGFNLLRLDRPGDKRGGGIACLINNKVSWSSPNSI